MQKQQKREKVVVYFLRSECVFYFDGSDACLCALDQFRKFIGAGCGAVGDDRNGGDSGGGNCYRVFSMAYFHGVQRII